MSTASRPRVAAIHQPWSRVDPPVDSADSIALWTDQVMRRLARSCDVVCYSRAWKGLPDSSHCDGVAYAREPVSIDRWLRRGLGMIESRGWHDRTRPFFASPWCFRQFIGHVIRDLVRRGGADVIHVQNVSQFLPLLRGAFPKAKLVLHMHAEWLAQLDRNWLAPRVAAADSIVFCSNYLAEQTRRAWPQHAPRCRPIYNGVTLEEFDHAPTFTPTKRGPRLLFVSRVSPDKGVHVLVDAFNQVVERHPDAELKIVGPFEMLPKAYCIDLTDEPIVRELARFYRGPSYIEQLKLRASPAASRQTEITGAIGRAELVRHFQEADVYVMPSIYPEGFGIPIIEAAACRVPTVCTHRGGMPEVVEDQKTGIIVPADDADALASAIIRLLDDQALRMTMGQAARARVERLFTWDRIAQMLLSEYQGLLDSRARNNGIEISVPVADPAATSRGARLPEHVVDSRELR